MSSVSVSEGTQISSGIYTGKMNAQKTIGCFATPTPLVDHGPYIYQSGGNCQKVCYSLGKPVMAMSGGTNCSCGDLLPPKDSKVGDEKCNTPCVGYNPLMCGGPDYWLVVLTGITPNEIPYLAAESISSSSTSQQPAKVVTLSGSTVIQTVDPSSDSDSSNSSSNSSGGGSNTVGIAVGVVVGVLVLGIIIGAVLFFLKRRQRKLEQEEYEQKQSVQQFVAGGGKGYSSHSQTSMGDSRLDPEVMMSRRQSDGSIMDNQDYSRRILKVTN